MNRPALSFLRRSGLSSAIHAKILNLPSCSLKSVTTVTLSCENSEDEQIDGARHEAQLGERLIDLINRAARQIPQVCYHPQMGPIQTCDTCMVDVDGKLVRACGMPAAEGMKVATESARAQNGQREAFDRILGNHLLYCTVCDNNNGNCTGHNTTKLLKVEYQATPFKPKPYDKDFTNPFYRNDPDQCILCGRCVEA